MNYCLNIYLKLFKNFIFSSEWFRFEAYIVKILIRINVKSINFRISILPFKDRFFSKYFLKINEK